MRRGVAAVGALCLVAVVGSAGVVASGLTSTEAVPVSAVNPAVLPDRLAHDMPVALPDLGAGEVTAVGVRQRSSGLLWWTDPVSEVVGVQAATGTYGVIDTPGLVSGGVEAVWLSPDGAHLAYYRVAEQLGDVAGSLVVRNLVDGAVVEHDMDAEFGVRADEESVRWIDDEHVLVMPNPFTDADLVGSSSSAEDWFILGVDGEAVALPEPAQRWPESNSLDGSHLVDRDDSEEYDQPDWAVVDVLRGTTWEVATFPEIPGAGLRGRVWDGASTVASFADDTPEISGDTEVEVVFADLQERGEPGGQWLRSGVEVPDWSRPVGWREGSLLVDTWTELVQVGRDGSVQTLSDLGSEGSTTDTADWGAGGAVQRWSFATDLVAEAEVVTGPAPGTDPARWLLRALPVILPVAAVAAVFLLVVGAGLRRRRGRRESA